MWSLWKGVLTEGVLPPGCRKGLWHSSAHHLANCLHFPLGEKHGSATGHMVALGSHRKERAPFRAPILQLTRESVAAVRRLHSSEGYLRGKFWRLIGGLMSGSFGDRLKPDSVRPGPW